MSFAITLIHIGGERRVMQVESVSPTLNYLTIRWGQSGLYDLNLVHNKLTARSKKAQRKGKPHWSAEDIVAVRKMAKEYLKQKQTDGADMFAAKDEAFRKHIESMPGFKSTDLKSSVDTFKPVQDAGNVYSDGSRD